MALDIDGTLDVRDKEDTIANAILRAQYIGVHIAIVSARMVPVLWGVHPTVRHALDRARIREFMYNPWSPISTNQQVADKKASQLLRLKAQYEKVVFFDDKLSNVLAARRHGIPAFKVTDDRPISAQMVDSIFF